MDRYQIVEKIKAKPVEPKYYSVLLRTSGNPIQEWLWAGVAYTLDDALIIAKLEMALVRLRPDAYFLAMFRAMPARDVINAMSSMELKKIEEPKAKNDEKTNSGDILDIPADNGVRRKILPHS